MEKLILGIDVGSTSIKAIAFGVDGRQVAAAKRATPFLADEEGVHYNADLLWSCVAEAVTELTAKCGGEITTVAVTGFGNDGVPLDKQNEPLYPFISWKCSRSIPQFEAFVGQNGRKWIFDHSGMQARPIDALYKLLWLKEYHPQCLEKMDCWLMMEDYVNYKLCGEIVTDHTVAFTSGIYDPGAEQWSDAILERAGLPRNVMPPVQKSGTAIGEVTQAAAAVTGLAAGTPVVLGGWDIECASFALGAFKPGILMDIMGTWETLMPSSDTYIRNDMVFELGLNACHHVAEGMYSYPVYFVSSAMVEWFIASYYGKENDEITSDRLYERLIDEVKHVQPGSKGALFLPNLFGAATPVVDGRSRGAFVGLSDETRRPEMARATLEGLSFMCRQVLIGCEAFMGDRLKELVVCGGGSRNDEWCRIKADVIGRDIAISGLEETTALGVALKAAVGVGIFSNDNEAVEAAGTEYTRIAHVPEASRKYEKPFAVYDKLYRCLKDINHAISGMVAERD